MAEVIRMPKMSDTMTEGVIASWLVKVGDEVSSGDILAEVETDKATMELESYEDGVILHIGVAAGDAVPVDGVLAVVGEEGEDFQALLSGDAPEAAAQEVVEETPAVEVEEVPAVDLSGIPATVVLMPKMSDTMTEGLISSWLVKVGDEVNSGDILAEVETDKATMELECYEDGTLLYIGVEAGSSIAVDGVIAIIGEPGTDYAPLLNAPAKSSVPKETVKVEAPKVEAPKEKTPKKTAPKKGKKKSTERVFVSPLAKLLAEEKGYSLNKIEGSGENGRIIKRDVEDYEPVVQVATSAVAAVAGEESFEEVKLTSMRKVIAKRLAESKFNAPHFYLTMEVDMTNAMAARKSMNEVSPSKISFNDIVVKATAAALKSHPNVNTWFMGDHVRINKHVHIGIAVAIEAGLVVPTLKFASEKSLSQISTEVKDLAGKAKDMKLKPNEMEGSTFTISNLGMFGIDQFTSIINPPSTCILAVGGIKQTPIIKDGEVKVGNIMKLTLSCDHRAVDGMVGASFLKDLKGLLEDPIRLLV